MFVKWKWFSSMLLLYCKAFSWLVDSMGPTNKRNKRIEHVWLVVGPPLWKIWVRQLGWWHSQYSWENAKFMATIHHQSVSYIQLFQSILGPSRIQLRQPFSSESHPPKSPWLAVVTSQAQKSKWSAKHSWTSASVYCKTIKTRLQLVCMSQNGWFIRENPI